MDQTVSFSRRILEVLQILQHHEHLQAIPMFCVCRIFRKGPCCHPVQTMVYKSLRAHLKFKSLLVGSVRLPPDPWSNQEW